MKKAVVQLCRVEKGIVSTSYKVSHILFIYLVGRVCIPGIFGWFVLLFFCLCNFFFFLKETRPPWRRITTRLPPPPPSPRRQTSPWSASQNPAHSGLQQNALQGRELVSVGQDFSGKQGSLFQRAQITLQWL